MREKAEFLMIEFCWCEGVEVSVLRGPGEVGWELSPGEEKGYCGM